MDNNLINLIYQLKFANEIWQIIIPLIFMCADFITGFIQSLINGTTSSKIMRKGLLHKILLIIIIILSFLLQYGLNIPLISNFVCIYLVIMELTSILENIKKAGINLGILENIIKGEIKK